MQYFKLEPYDTDSWYSIQKKILMMGKLPKFAILLKNLGPDLQNILQFITRLS